MEKWSNIMKNMKKIFNLAAMVLGMILLTFTPGIPVTVNALAGLLPTATEYHFATPTQNQQAFVMESKAYDLSSWTAPSNNRLVSQQLTAENNSDFNKTYPDNSLISIQNHEPYVIATTTLNTPSNGAFKSSEITLQPNSYYKVSVDYCIVEQKNNETENYAFGTFYLNDNKIDLLSSDTTWHTAIFYAYTDKLESATVSAELYFGSRDKYALGAIYFDNFNVTAIRQATFETETQDIDSLRVLDFTHKNAYILEKDFANTDFTASKTTANADSKNSIQTSNVPTLLNFEDVHYFYTKDNTNGDVMLLKAYDANASLTLSNYTFKPQPHEVYMFQFYSIATSSEDFNGFYLMIGNTAEQIANLSDYPYHNGWQLNTIFFVAGNELNQEYDLSFNLSNNENGTGWACIDDFKIYKVSGSYATDNASSLGVHDTYDQNKKDDGSNDLNGYFELGTSTEITNNSYPYPLIADTWTTNVETNGIVNLDPSLWISSINHPGYPVNSLTNNNVYMMHNATETTNLVTSAALNVTVSGTTYISFDAYGNSESQVTAYILTAETGDDSQLTNEVILSNKMMQINDGEWHHYTFEINDIEYASSRNYYLRFDMRGEGYAYFDNVRVTTETDSQYTNPNGTTIESIDMSQQWLIKGLWKSSDEFNKPTIEENTNCITFNNAGISNQKATIKYSLAYNLTYDENTYYEFVIKAYGNNAYLGISNYDGLLEVINNDSDNVKTYKLYVCPSEDATTVNLQITLGHIAKDSDDTEVANGYITIQELNVNSMTKDDFDLIKEKVDDDAFMKVLSLSEADDTDDTDDSNTTTDNSFFGENWWYLIPTLITAIALLLAMATFLLRKIKFDKHITKKTTSYARDMKLKNQQKKIVAQKAVKVDNITDEQKNN